VLGAPLIVRPGDASSTREACFATSDRSGSVGLGADWAGGWARVCKAACVGMDCVAVVLAALLAVLMPASAAPGEAVSMDFACRVSAGRVLLENSADRTYRILGKRDVQTLRVCSGASAAGCRMLEIHRFALECDGNVVQWVDAAAAAVRGQPWRATLVDGRMTLHYWPEGPAKDRRLPLTLPAGFAPAPATGWRFESVEAPVREGPPASQPSVAATRGEIATLRPIHSAAGPSSTQPLAPTPARNGLQLTSDLPPTTNQPMGQGWSATVVVGGEGEANPWWSPFALGTGQDALLALIGLAALLLSATAVAARQHVAVRFPFGSAAQSGPESVAGGIDTSALSKTASPPPPPLPRTGRLTDVADHVSELASALAAAPSQAPRTASGWDAVIEMRTTAEALLELVRQMIADHVPAGALRDVLIADIDAIFERLDGSELAAALAQGRLDLVHPVYAQAILDLERVRTLAQIEHQRALETVGEPERTPATVEEACAFLGINPRASQPVVKKVVDALRQNWHPDLADDEIDRRLREERIKRINAAWDLIRAG